MPCSGSNGIIIYKTKPHTIKAKDTEKIPGHSLALSVTCDQEFAKGKMGKHDSTKTRVVPIFDHLYRKDRSGQSWIRKLISLPVGGQSVLLPVNCDLTIQEAGWGDKEKGLDPPVALLSWLIRHPRPPLSGTLSSDPKKAQKRMDCRIRDAEA